MKKIATLSALAFVLATAGAFARTPAAQDPATGAKTSTSTAKTAKKTAHHHKKGVKKGATTPQAPPAQK